jgi:hypothetical protein
LDGRGILRTSGEIVERNRANVVSGDAKPEGK